MVTAQSEKLFVKTSWKRILWYKDGSVLDTVGSQDRFLMLPDGSLFFLSTRDTDSGSYYCAVLSEDIEYNSDTAVLTVARLLRYWRKRYQCRSHVYR